MEPKTAKEFVEAWDRGEIVSTLEMGGIGPGYEQAIQIAVVEFTRALLDRWSEINDVVDGICSGKLREINDSLGGLSRAQYGAAKYLAWMITTEGPARLLERYRQERPDDKDRIILVSKQMPKEPDGGATKGGA